MEYVAVYNDPARRRAALGAMAVSTNRLLLTTAYANNLMRSPVEVAQAALALQALTGGRYEVGLGAGWAEAEITGSSLDYPDARGRAQRFREAVMVVRDLLSGPCHFDGQHYTIDLPAAGPPTDPPPPLAAALGGPWTTKHIGPLLDKLDGETADVDFNVGPLNLEEKGSFVLDLSAHVNLFHLPMLAPSPHAVLFRLLKPGTADLSHSVTAPVRCHRMSVRMNNTGLHVRSFTRNGPVH